MPSTRPQSVSDSENQEYRIQSAISAYNNGDFSSMRAAARSFNVPVNTLLRRSQGIPQRAKTRANSHKLTQLEEESLVDQINSMISRGSAPSRQLVREMADALLAARGDPVPNKVGHHWVYNFIKRTPSIAARYLRGDKSHVPTRPAPKSANDFERQALAIISSLRSQSDDSSALLKALQQIIKGYQQVLLETARLERENKHLRAENRQLALDMEDDPTDGNQMPCPCGLAGCECLQPRQNEIESNTNVSAESTDVGESGNQRPRRKCGLCRKPGHKRDRCPDMESALN